MENYYYSFEFPEMQPQMNPITVGVAGSGNLEISVQANPNLNVSEIWVSTGVGGYKSSWDAVIARFMQEHPYGGLSFTLKDAGATPPVVALRLGQALETYQTGYRKNSNYIESNSRTRILSLVDEGSFQEFLSNVDCSSPNLPDLNLQTASDDGVVIGRATFQGIPCAIASQEKDFIGGAVGEVHGAKLIGLIRYAIKHTLSACIFLIDSGGVRLQEANVGEIEISEIIRALLDAKSAGIKSIGVVCSQNGAYGGMGIISGIMDSLIVNQTGRIGVSGAEVIQAVKGAEVFDSSDRPLIWRVYGGRTRYLQRAAQSYSTHDIKSIRTAILEAMQPQQELINTTLLTEEQRILQQRIEQAHECSEEGEWLEKYKPQLYAQDVFGVTDQEFQHIVQGEEHGI